MQEATKVCSKCRQEKPEGEFYRRKDRKNGLWACCKVCADKLTESWRKRNPEHAKTICKNWVLNNRERVNATGKRWRLRHPDLAKATTKKWRENHPEEQKEATRRWRAANIERFNEVNKIWKANHPDILRISKKASNKKIRSTFKGLIDHRMSKAIRCALRGKKRGRCWISLVDYTLEDLKIHLESQFKDGMTWDAFMRGQIHIDHVVPKSRFNYKTTGDPEFKVCWGLSNLQPMWAKDNLRKQAKTMEEWEKHKKLCQKKF